jgi:two-component system, response regulator, stage 0 sporulation protein F
MLKKIEKEKKGRKPTILVIDDELNILEFFERILGYEEYTVITACNGPKGIEKNEEYDPDLIILDLKMPGMQGMEVLKNIRKVDKDVIVIILTGYGDAESIREAADLNVYEYISKPTTLETIKGVIKEAITSGGK